jgi:aminoglycoside phosphotransferase (APT) family kinase protein
MVRSKNKEFIKKKKRAREMAQWLRVLTALSEVPSSNPSNHMVAHNHL